MRKTNINDDFYTVIYNYLNNEYSGSVSSQFLEDIKIEDRTYPWITIKTAVYYDNVGLKQINKRSGIIRILCYSLDEQEAFSIQDNIATIIEDMSNDNEIYVTRIRTDADKLNIEGTNPYWKSLDVEVELYINGKDPNL